MGIKNLQLIESASATLADYQKHSVLACVKIILVVSKQTEKLTKLEPAHLLGKEESKRSRHKSEKMETTENHTKFENKKKLKVMRKKMCSNFEKLDQDTR